MLLALPLVGKDGHGENGVCWTSSCTQVPGDVLIVSSSEATLVQQLQLESSPCSASVTHCHCPDSICPLQRPNKSAEWG